jgi:hypothetical protein
VGSVTLPPRASVAVTVAPSTLGAGPESSVPVVREACIIVTVNERPR